MLTLVHHFEEARSRVTLLYPYLDLSIMDPFKVVRNKEWMTKNNSSSSFSVDRNYSLIHSRIFVIILKCGVMWSPLY